ncbi:MAG: hypothetical protein Q8J85_07090 [Sulfuricurvum sp.]|nr:hypothetical protein [Sulfuricurvum sp.]MDP3023009.1 hypothetical protein [Sulfuricurvum sp.]
MENLKLICEFDKETLSKYVGQVFVGNTEYNLSVIILKAVNKHSINVNVKNMEEGIYRNIIIEKVKKYVNENIMNTKKIKMVEKIEEFSIVNKTTTNGQNRRVFVF